MYSLHSRICVLGSIYNCYYPSRVLHYDLRTGNFIPDHLGRDLHLISHPIQDQAAMNRRHSQLNKNLQCVDIFNGWETINLRLKRGRHEWYTRKLGNPACLSFFNLFPSFQLVHLFWPLVSETARDERQIDPSAVAARTIFESVIVLDYLWSPTRGLIGGSVSYSDSDSSGEFIARGGYRIA